MKKLTEFAKNGMHYKIIRREGNVAIAKASIEKGLGAVAYDVILIREREETKLFNNIVPAAEYGPSNENFGVFGFSYPNLEMANKKFDWIIETDYFNRNKK